MSHGEYSVEANPIETARRYAQENGAGLLGSAVLHAIVAFLVLFYLTERTTQAPSPSSRFLPVDLVQLGDTTTSPPQTRKAPTPHQQSHHIAVPETTSPTPPEGVSPRKTREAPVDNFAARLKALSHLRQTPTPLPALDNSADSDADATSDNAAPGDEAAYAVKDFIRAQVQRRWSVDFSLIGHRNFAVLIRMQMKRDGTVTMAEILDQHRYKTDAVYREVALSARNAVLLSSPFSLPAGQYRPVMDMTLSFDPRDTLH